MTGPELTRVVLRNIDRMCDERDVSRSEMARRAGMTPQYYFSLCSQRSRKRGLSLNLVARFAAALDVEPAVLLKVAP